MKTAGRDPIYSFRIGPRLSLPWTLLAALAAVIVRLPFLLKADGFFGSDEAVEGLMALHLADLPIFFWGQGYKGVPEVYLMAGAFAVFGASVIALKAVTLALWAVAVALTVRLAYAWYGSQVAVITALLVIVAPPAMVAWSLSGNSEVAILTGLVAAFALLAWPARIDTQRGDTSAATRRPLPLGVFVLAGVMMWIHPVSSCAIGALALMRFVGSPAWIDRTGRISRIVEVVLARDARGWLRAALLTLHVAIALIAALFVFTYAGGSLQVGPLSATHPQRSIRPLMLLGGLAFVGHAFSGRFMPRRRAGMALLSFLAGLSPVLLQAARGGGVGTPVITRHLAEAPAMLSGVVTEILPVFLGVTDVGGATVDLPWWSALPMVIGAATAFVMALRAGPRAAAQFFPWTTALAVVGLLVVGGGFGGTQTARYLLPFFGLFAMTVAAGLTTLARGHAAVAAVLTAACLAPLALGQARWYARLHDDPSALVIARCLEDRAITYARADYWIAYPLTFLAGERVIVVPDPTGDRYPAYRRAVEAAGAVPRVQAAAGAAAEGDISNAALSASPGSLLCSSPSLLAVWPPISRP